MSPAAALFLPSFFSAAGDRYQDVQAVLGCLDPKQPGEEDPLAPYGVGIMLYFKFNKVGKPSSLLCLAVAGSEMAQARWHTLDPFCTTGGATLPKDAQNPMTPKKEKHAKMRAGG